MKPIFRSTIFALILVIGQAFGGYIIGPLFVLFHVTLPVALVLSQILTLLIPTIIYFMVTKQSVKEVLRLNPIGILDVIIIMCIAVLCEPAASFIGYVSSLFFPNLISQVVSDLNSIPLIIKIVIMALTPAICEEITVRGVILSGYKNVNQAVSAVITGLIFGILHMNFQQFFYAFALGILLAYLVHITNSIFASMVCHFTFNAVPTLLTVFVSKAASADTNKLGTSETIATVIGLFIMAVIFSALAGVLLWALICLNKHKKMKKELEVSTNCQVSFNQEMNLVLNEPKEKIFNWPFTAIICVFIIAQLLDFCFK